MDGVSVILTVVFWIAISTIAALIVSNGAEQDRREFNVPL